MAPGQAPHKRRLAGRACEARHERGGWTKTLPYIVTHVVESANSRFQKQLGYVEALKGRSITPYDLPKAYDRRLGARPPSCYKFEMSKTIEQWLLFEYIGLEFTPLSKPFKTREQVEKACEKYPERLRKRIGLGVIRIKG
jgi:hypothetical protein